ncbi:MAG: hypothetical protein LBD08_05170 [Treponema sp.]|nr:hypothetical protein [Treponema sp.]
MGAKIAYSSDGESWTAVSDSTFSYDDTINGIAWGGGTFVAVGTDGKIAYCAE